jgi:glutathione peroxidase
MQDRRQLLGLVAGALAAPAVAQAQSAAMSRITAFAFSFPGIEGGDIRLADYAGKPVLIVNTASLCGFTPQYAGLQQLWARYHQRGLMIVGVPSNDFGGQEPGGATEILHTAHADYGVAFPLAAKAAVKGSSPHPFYKWAAGERPLETPRWNFHKYLIGRDGHIAAVFPPDIEPMDARVINAVVKELPRATAEIRVLSVGSVQIAAKTLAADFTQQTGSKATLTIVTPSDIPQKLAGATYDMIICSIPAMEALDKAGALVPGSRSPLAGVGIGIMVREGTPLPDVSTPEAFKKTLLAARSIVHGNPATPNQSGVVTMRILAKAGILDAIKPKARPADLADGFAMVATGEVELALFNLVELPPGVRLVGPVPAPLQDYTSYETAVLANGAAPTESQAFIKLMVSPPARKIWEAASLEAYPYP